MSDHINMGTVITSRKDRRDDERPGAESAPNSWEWVLVSKLPRASEAVSAQALGSARPRSEFERCHFQAM